MIVKMSKLIGRGGCVSSIGDFTSVRILTTASGLKGKAFSGNHSRTFRGCHTCCRCQKVSSVIAKRPTLKHEGRVVQLFHAHPAIPAMYAYGQLPYFEYQAMELLGSSVEEVHSVPHALPATTVLQIADQMVNRSLLLMSTITISLNKPF
jgi:hypothetical protein